MSQFAAVLVSPRGPLVDGGGPALDSDCPGVAFPVSLLEPHATQYSVSKLFSPHIFPGITHISQGMILVPLEALLPDLLFLFVCPLALDL